MQSNHMEKINNQNHEDDHDDDQLLEFADKLGKNLTLEEEEEEEEEDYDEIDDNDDEEDEDDFEFSFGGEEVKSPVSADEVFHNGQIRPTIPFYTGEVSEEPPPVKVYVVSSTSENDNVVEGPYCVWGTEENNNKQVMSPEMNRKSNSTGFSRLRKMKDFLLVRSNSDGKDTFVFLNGKASEKKVKKNKSVVEEIDVGVEASEKVKKKKGKATMSGAYEALYGKKDKKNGGEKSYLPYKVGFFTNVNGLSKNVHPY